MKFVLSIFMFGLALLAPVSLKASIAVPPDAKHEATWKKFNDVVENKSSEIKALAFGPITKIMGMLALAYAVMSVWITNSTRQLVMFGGIGILMTIAPSFIDTLFSAILPGM